jgi:hypothetical protein
MKIYSKLLGKIRNNKTRVKKAVGTVTIAVGLRYDSINSIPTNLSSNSTKQVEQVHNYVEEDMQVINTDGKVKDGLSQKSSSHFIKTGSGAVIEIRTSVQPSEALKSALEVRCGDLGKSGPGARAKADASRNAKAGKFSSGSTIIPGASGYVPQKTYCLSNKNRPPSCQPTPDPHNPGCAVGPRSITVLSGQQNQSEYQPDGYSKEQILIFEKNPRYSELAKDPELIGQERETNPKSKEEACTILQTEDEGLFCGLYKNTSDSHLKITKYF